MLERPEEYEIMATAEANHWWYRALHELCLRAVKKWQNDKNIKILDAGCGTGGLMMYLTNHGYKNIVGFDLSDIAVAKCIVQELNVWQQDIRTIPSAALKTEFDAIICNDILCYLSERELTDFFQNCFSLLCQKGIIIINVPALAVFSGTHDLAVGIKQRFSRSDYKKYIDSDQYEILTSRYWPFFLAPIIYTTRLLQRIKLRFFKFKKIESDIKIPSEIINYFLLKICKFEIKYLAQKAPFGSSLFLIIQKRDISAVCTISQNCNIDPH